MFDVPGYRIVRVLGVVYGLTVRARNWAATLGMVAKSIAGGELKWFTNMLYSARNDAINRMVEECLRRGGNAVVAMGFDQGSLETYATTTAYGTACLVEKIDDSAPEYPQLAKGSSEPA